MRSGDWVILELPSRNDLSGKWKVVEYPTFEHFFGFDRDSARLYRDGLDELTVPKKYLRYDNYPEVKIIMK